MLLRDASFDGVRLVSWPRGRGCPGACAAGGETADEWSLAATLQKYMARVHAPALMKRGAQGKPGLHDMLLALECL